MPNPIGGIIPQAGPLNAVRLVSPTVVQREAKSPMTELKLQSSCFLKPNYTAVFTVMSVSSTCPLPRYIRVCVPYKCMYGIHLCPFVPEPLSLLQWEKPVSCYEGGSGQRAQPAQKMLTRSLSICLSARVSATGHDCRNPLVCSFNQTSLPGFKWTETPYTDGHPCIPILNVLVAYKHSYLYLQYHVSQRLGHFSLQLFNFPCLFQERPAPV